MNQREIYKLNHSAIRAIARYEESGANRQKRIQKECESRRYLHGEQENLGARMAIRTFDSPLPDWMPTQLECMGAHLGVNNPSLAKSFSRLRFASYQAYRSGRLPR